MRGMSYPRELRKYGVLRSSAMHFGVQVSLAYGPTPRHEAGYELTYIGAMEPRSVRRAPLLPRAVGGPAGLGTEQRPT
jgi:hypothetical protein